MAGENQIDFCLYVVNAVCNVVCTGNLRRKLVCVSEAIGRYVDAWMDALRPLGSGFHFRRA